MHMYDVSHSIKQYYKRTTKKVSKALNCVLAASASRNLGRCFNYSPKKN